MADVAGLIGSQMGDYAGAAIGLGLVVIGAGVGIGLIGAKAIDASARQPEMKDEIRTLMILGAALVEGVAFFGAVICLLIVLLK